KMPMFGVADICLIPGGFLAQGTSNRAGRARACGDHYRTRFSVARFEGDKEFFHYRVLFGWRGHGNIHIILVLSPNAMAAMVKMDANGCTWGDLLFTHATHAADGRAATLDH